MQEPKRNNDINALELYLVDRYRRLIRAMQARGFDAILWETRRAKERQRWLYGQGRSKFQCIRAGISPAYAQPGKPVVTKTLKSLHIVGKAADIVSKSRLWSWPEFYVALKEEAERLGLHTLGFEGCHAEFRG